MIHSTVNLVLFYPETDLHDGGNDDPPPAYKPPDPPTPGIDGEESHELTH